MSKLRDGLGSIPEPISKKLGEIFKKAADGSDFQKVLASFDIPYDYKDQAQMEKEVPVEYEWYKTFLKKMGVKAEK